MMNPHFLLDKMSISCLSWISIGALMSTVIAIIINEISFAKKHKLQAEISELPNADVVAVKKQSAKTEKDENCIRGIEIILLIIGLIIMLYAESLAASAKSKGAYGGYRQTETIASVMKAQQYGFDDESDLLPEDLSGSIIIYFKYGCGDCYDIHDELTDTLKNRNNHIYFISTKSETGETLLKKYPVAEVPSAIYITKENSEQNAYAQVLLYEPSNENTEHSVFIKNNLEQLIEMQKEGY